VLDRLRVEPGPLVSPALYLIDTSGLFRILQDKLRQAWSEQLTAGVIAICPIVLPHRRAGVPVLGAIPGRPA